MRETMLEEILRGGFAELGLEPDVRAEERYRIYYENIEETVGRICKGRETKRKRDCREESVRMAATASRRTESRLP